MLIVLTARHPTHKLDEIGEESEEEENFLVGIAGQDLYEEHNVNFVSVQCFLILNNYPFRITFEPSGQRVPILFLTHRILTLRHTSS